MYSKYILIVFQKSSREGGRRPRDPNPAEREGSALPVGDYEKNRKALDDQRHRDYQEYLKQKQVGFTIYIYIHFVFDEKHEECLQ